MISPWTIYWIMQLDSIRIGMGVATALSGMAFVGLLIFRGMHASDDDYSWNRESLPARREFRAGLRKYAKVAFALCLAFGVVKTMTPASNTVAAMILIPAIANNETVQKEAGELYQLAKDGLRELVKPEKENSK